MTRAFLSELIQRRFYAGDISDDAGLTIEEINAWLDFGIAAAAMKNYGDTAQLDVENVADGFYYSYSNIALVRDLSTQYYIGSLPTIPLALPKGYDITGVYIEGDDTLSQGLVRIAQQYIGYYKDLRMPQYKIPFWIEGKQIFIDSKYVLDGKTIRVRMAGAAADTDLTTELAIPSDLVDFVVNMVYSKLLPLANMKPDLSNDGVDVK